MDSKGAQLFGLFICLLAFFSFYVVQDHNPGKWYHPQWPGLLNSHRHAQSPIFQVILESLKLSVLTTMGTHAQGLGRFITRQMGGHVGDIATGQMAKRKCHPMHGESMPHVNIKC